MWKTGIQELDISLNPLGNQGVKFLAENGLFIKMKDPKSQRIINDYNRKSNLRKLNLTETKFSEMGYYFLLKNLVRFHNLNTLILDYNQCELKNTTHLSELIKDSRIHTLSMNYCRLGDTVGQAIGLALDHSKYIKELRVKKNEFRDKTALNFALAIENNNGIQSIDLSCNLI